MTNEPLTSGVTSAPYFGFVILNDGTMVAGECVRIQEKMGERESLQVQFYYGTGVKAVRRFYDVKDVFVTIQSTQEKCGRFYDQFQKNSYPHKFSVEQDASVALVQEPGQTSVPTTVNAGEPEPQSLESIGEDDEDDCGCPGLSFPFYGIVYTKLVDSNQIRMYCVGKVEFWDHYDNKEIYPVSSLRISGVSRYNAYETEFIIYLPVESVVCLIQKSEDWVNDWLNRHYVPSDGFNTQDICEADSDNRN